MFKAGGGVGFMVYYTIALFFFMMIWTGIWLSTPPMTDCAAASYGPYVAQSNLVLCRTGASPGGCYSYAGGTTDDRPISLLQA